jgi:hypothetical protein
MNVKEGWWGDQQERGGERERILRGEEDWNMLLVYVWWQHKETQQTLFEKGRGQKEWEYNGGDEPVKSTELHRELLSYY